MEIKEITKLVNNAWDAIDNSKIGPVEFGKDDKGNPIHKTVCINAFITILQCICPKSVTGDMEVGGGMEMREPKEDWKG